MTKALQLLSQLIGNANAAQAPQRKEIHDLWMKQARGVAGADNTLLNFSTIIGIDAIGMAGAVADHIGASFDDQTINRIETSVHILIAAAAVFNSTLPVNRRVDMLVNVEENLV